jgi:hypothetical protein
MGRVLRLVAITGAAMMCSCVKVPKNEGASDVRFNEVVKRVKCDLVQALRHRATSDSRFNFLTQWAAKVHMTLTVDDTATVNPGLSVIEPLAVAGTTFTFGAGGSFSGQAVRQEDYEFFMSFMDTAIELSDGPTAINLYDDCAFAPGLLLESNLDLDSMFERALGPVGAGTLYASHQVGPGSNTSPARPANEAQNVARTLSALKSTPEVQVTAANLVKSTPEGPAKTRLNEIFSQIEKAPEFHLDNTTQEAAIKKKQDDVAKAIANSAKLEKDVQLVITTVVTPLYELGTTANFPAKCLTEMLGFRIKAAGAAADVTIEKINIENADPKNADDILNTFDKEQRSKKDVFENANNMLTKLQTCHIPKPEPAVAAPAVYDPIDLIQETVNFYITTSGSVTPSWKLVRISAPLTTPFLSGQIKNTDTIIITMGRPDIKDGKAVASTTMNLNQQAAILSQAINQRLVP